MPLQILAGPGCDQAVGKDDYLERVRQLGADDVVISVGRIL